LYFTIVPLPRRGAGRNGRDEKELRLPPRRDRGEHDETYCDETLTRLRRKRNIADLNLRIDRRARVRQRDSIRQVGRDARPIACRFFDDIPEHVCVQMRRQRGRDTSSDRLSIRFSIHAATGDDDSRELACESRVAICWTARWTALRGERVKDPKREKRYGYTYENRNRIEMRRDQPRGQIDRSLSKLLAIDLRDCGSFRSPRTRG